MKISTFRRRWYGVAVTNVALGLVYFVLAPALAGPSFRLPEAQ